MSGIWGSAARQHALLDGLVDLADAERETETMTDVESVLRGRKRGHVTEPPTGVQTPTNGATTMSDLAFRSQLDALAALLPGRHEQLPADRPTPETPAPPAAFAEGLQFDVGHFDDFLGSLMGAGAESIHLSAQNVTAPSTTAPIAIPSTSQQQPASVVGAAPATQYPLPADGPGFDWATMFSPQSDPWTIESMPGAPAAADADPWRDLLSTFPSSTGLSPESARSEHA